MSNETKCLFVIFSTGASNKFELETKVSLSCMNFCWTAKLIDKLDLHFCAFKIVEEALPGEQTFVLSPPVIASPCL